MSLVNCIECGKEISDRATCCPGCGCPVKIIETSNECVEIDNETDEENNGEHSVFGVASFVLALIAATMSMFGLLHTILVTILLVISFVIGSIGLFVKKGKYGFAIAGNVISFIFFFYSFISS